MYDKELSEGKSAMDIAKEFGLPESPKGTPSVEIAKSWLKEFNVKFKSIGYEKSPGLTGKDIDVFLEVDDLSKIKDKNIFTENLKIHGKPIDIFVTDGKDWVVSKQISKQQAQFTDIPKPAVPPVAMPSAPDPIIAEARKYKRAEEFVKSNEWKPKESKYPLEDISLWY